MMRSVLQLDLKHLGGTFGDDITFKKDSVVLNFGVDSDVTITHDPDDGLIFKSVHW